MGKSDGAELVDEISVAYQTAPWGKPAKLVLKELSQADGIATLEVRVLRRRTALPCLDAANLVRFGLTGDGRLLDNLGTAGGSRAVQLANGRAQISVQLTGARAVACVAAEGLSTEFLVLTNRSPSGRGQPGQLPQTFGCGGH